MDKKQFSILLVSSLFVIFLSIFFSFWFFVGKQQSRYVEPSPPAIPTVKMNDSGSGQPPKERKMTELERREFEKQQREFVEDFWHVDLDAIKTYELANAYKISISLKPFNNDSKNIKITVQNNLINISAKYEANDKNKENYSRFSQSVELPYKIDEKIIQKSKKGDKFIIIIPKPKN